MATSFDSNDFVISYTTRDAYQMSLEWFRVSDDLNSIELMGSYVEEEEELDKFDKIYLEKTGGQLSLFAFNCPEGEVHVFGLNGDKVERTTSNIQIGI